MIMVISSCLQEQLEAMEEGLDKAKSAFSQLDAQMSQSTQTATKIGDRLHVRPSALCHTHCLACL